MRPGQHLIVMLAGGVMFGIGAAILLQGGVHDHIRDYIGAGSMGLGGLFFATGDPRQAFALVRSVLPFAKGRASGTFQAAGEDHPHEDGPR